MRILKSGTGRWKSQREVWLLKKGTGGCSVADSEDRVRYQSEGMRVASSSWKGWGNQFCPGKEHSSEDILMLG